MSRRRKTSPQLKALCAALLLPLPLFAQEIPAGASFFDDFETLDEGLWGISDGWVNGDWQNCMWSEENLRVERGVLWLTFANQPNDKRDYTCGEIQSRHVYGYGTYEARFRTGTGSGLNAAFFTYIGPHHGRPHDEIDFEVLLRDTRAVSLNTYVSGAPKNGKRVPLPQPAQEQFISYAFIWDEDGIRWYVDGVLMHETPPGADLPVNDQKIYASLWGSDSFPNWMGPFAEPAGDMTMLVDWIAFTALGEPCQFPQSLVCQDG
ncbi:family 16 glycosylhydrolase [Cognatiyoonia sp. IB215446]|uniref:endo-1,3-1,4-beta-glycanase ExoK n=1 Tax=Cognatiyoonia sp. IB215446 TaxID=3097355 RepID=UPI002A122781|nr:family 16 glycosylhydrolase [Cognatiyoonia sp. IB215446]MDX8350614.1 family 16 glycosylhydrolase [Cognatiyoonia sp. IB215446]